MFKKLLVGLMISLFFAARVAAQSVDYYLPYPGILPDHPLYWLKMVRDRVGLMLTTGNTAKAEKLLLYADKRLGAAWALIEGNKVPLGVSTLTKAEKYLEQTVQLRDSFTDKDKLDKAIKKHLEVLALVKDKSGSYDNLVEEMIMKLEAADSQLPTKAVPVSVLVDFGIEAAEENKVEAVTAYEALEKVGLDQEWEILAKEYDFGRMVTSIDGYINNNKKAWIYSVNGVTADKAADQFTLATGDKVEWKYEAVKP